MFKKDVRNLVILILTVQKGGLTQTLKLKGFILVGRILGAFCYNNDYSYLITVIRHLVKNTI